VFSGRLGINDVAPGGVLTDSTVGNVKFEFIEKSSNSGK
jgi:hypothetical protein